MNILNKLGVNRTKQSGFTLIEILVVIGIIAILAVIVLIAINPARQFAQARDTQRVSNVNAILNAIGQRIADCKGIFEGACGTNPVVTCPTLPTTPTSIDSIANLDTCLVPTYLSEMPTDPRPSAAGNYKVSWPAGGRITVEAPSFEIASISVTR